MAFEVWPVTVPVRMIPGTYRERPDPYVDEFKPEQGPSIKGVAGSGSWDLVSWDQYLTQNEWALLKTFYRTTLNHGTKYFTLSNPQTATSETFEFVSPPEATDIGSQVHAQTAALKRQMTYRVPIALRRHN